VSDENFEAEASKMADGDDEPEEQNENAEKSVRHDNEMIDLSMYFGHVDTPQPEAVLVDDTAQLNELNNRPVEDLADTTDDNVLVVPVILDDTDEDPSVDTGPNGIIRITQAPPDSEALEGALANALDTASESGNIEIADADALTNFVPPNVSHEPPQRAFGEVTYTETVPVGIGDFGTVGGKQPNDDSSFDEPPSSLPPLRFRGVRQKRTNETISNQAATASVNQTQTDQPPTEATSTSSPVASSRQDVAGNDLSAALSALGVDDLALRDTVLTGNANKQAKKANDQSKSVGEGAVDNNERRLRRGLRGRNQRHTVPEPEVVNAAQAGARKPLPRPLLVFVSVGLAVGAVAIFVGLDRLTTASHHAKATTTPISKSAQPVTKPPSASGTTSKSKVSLSAACNEATKIVAIALTTSTPASTVETSLATDASVVSTLAHTAPAAWQPAVDTLGESISVLVSILQRVGWHYSAVPASDYSDIQTAAKNYNLGIQELNSHLRTCS
jgi:hypothetical protein